MHLKTFWSVLASLVAVSGLYVGLATIGQKWLFWLVIAASLGITLIRVIFPRALDLLEKIRRYDATAEELVRLIESRDGLLKQIASLKTDGLRAYTLGIADGHKQASGSHLALARPTPRLSEVIDLAGSVGFVATGPDLLQGARYSIVAARTGTLKGIVEITSFDAGDGAALLTCVESTSSSFWEELARQLELTNRVPPNIELEPYMPTTPGVELESDASQLQTTIVNEQPEAPDETQD